MKDTIITEGEPDARVTRLQELATARMRDPVVARRVAVLEREADSVISRASRAGLDISYQGIAPLFAETMAYSGDGSDWVISPVSPSEISVVPRSQQEVLRRIDASGIRFPVLYIAHEVPKVGPSRSGTSTCSPSDSCTRAKCRSWSVRRRLQSVPPSWPIA